MDHSDFATSAVASYVDQMADTPLSDLVSPGGDIAVRVTPKASRNRVVIDDTGEDTGRVRVYVTVAPEGGKANAAVQKLLAKALGVPKTSLTLIRGAASRDKVFRLERP